VSDDILADERLKRDTWGRLTEAQYNEHWLARVREKSVVTESGCLVWQGFLQTKGYGGTTYRGRNVAIHRQAFKILKKADLRTEDFVCHTCDTRACWNIDHLWLGKPADNSLDMVKKGRCHEWTRTHCPKGHPYDEENTIHRIAKSGRPARGCKACLKLTHQTPSYIEWRRNYQRRRRAEKRGASQ
jgi:hypothetical protein